jgi:peptide chain release factor 2
MEKTVPLWMKVPFLHVGEVWYTNAMGDIHDRISELEAHMTSPDFWNDKVRAQATIKELNELRDKAAGKGRYDKGDAIVTLLSGAGGDDAEDFSRMLYDMYGAYAKRKNWSIYVLHQNENDHGGYRNLTFEVQGKDAYGLLKHESGVHRLVRISPFNAKKLRHTSFSLVEVIPKFPKGEAVDIPEGDVKIEFSKSGGPGGQNVNKRETAVRVVHIPTNISVHVDSERSQLQNREKALEILKGKLYKKQEEDRQKEAQGFAVAKTMEIEWGNQIRSYVLHPYKMIKDHRTDVETHDVEHVLEDGDLDEFITAEHSLSNGVV